MRKPVYHIRDTRLFINAGMEIPVCKARARLLDIETRYRFSTRFPDTCPVAATCPRCLKLAAVKN